jgi:ABC-type Mn2+/Zn2+ transport system ATPase subunit
MRTDWGEIGVESAVFGYSSRPVVRVDAMRLGPRESVGIFGPNGAGKTTLVRGVVGLLPPISGRVRRSPAVRVGYLPQQRQVELHWPMNGLDAASLAVSSRRPLGWVGRTSGRVRENMKRLAVENLARRPFAKLSGGQQQRLLLAGALADDPDVLVLDEPTEGLDLHSRELFLSALSGAIADGLAAVMISHDVNDLLTLSDRIAWLHAAEHEGGPSRVEVIDPADFAARVISTGRVASARTS